MEHSANTKLNDAVTYRQFSRFLVHAEIPPTWKQPVIALEDVIKMPVPGSKFLSHSFGPDKYSSRFSSFLRSCLFFSPAGFDDIFSHFFGGGLFGGGFGGGRRPRKMKGEDTVHRLG